MTYRVGPCAGLLSALAVASLAACSSGAASSLTPTAASVATAVPAVTASTSSGPVSAVPGSSNNKYVTGPFTVTMKGIGLLPSKYDSVTEQDKTIPQSCAVVDVKNSSNTFTGWVVTQVEFVKGHSLQGQLLETDAADPTGGSSGGESDPLAPGQSEVLYACPQSITKKTYVEGQLISVSYGSPGQGTIDGTTVQLKY
jgi:hypothetical protein